MIGSLMRDLREYQNLYMEECKKNAILLQQEKEREEQFLEYLNLRKIEFAVPESVYTKEEEDLDEVILTFKEIWKLKE